MKKAIRRTAVAMAMTFVVTSSGFAGQVIDPDGIDLVYNNARNQLYYTSAGGFAGLGSVRDWTPILDGTLIYSTDTVHAFGRPLGGIDLSPDGETIWVARTDFDWINSDLSTAHFAKINIFPTEITNLEYNVTEGDSGTFDLVVGANGKGFLTNSFQGSGWTKFQEFDLDTGETSVRSDIRNAHAAGEISEEAFLDRSYDYRYILVQEGHNSSAPLHLYDSQTDTFIADTDNFENGASGGNWGITSLSGSTERIALSNGLDVRVYDFDFNLVHDFSQFGFSQIVGLQFDPSGAWLYASDAVNEKVLKIDATDWSVVEQFDPQGTFDWNSNHKNMDISADGRLLFFASSSGLEWLEVDPVCRTNGSGVIECFRDATTPIFSTADNQQFVLQNDVTLSGFNPFQFRHDNTTLTIDGTIRSDSPHVYATAVSFLRGGSFTNNGVIDISSNGVIYVQYGNFDFTNSGEIKYHDTGLGPQRRILNMTVLSSTVSIENTETGIIDGGTAFWFRGYGLPGDSTNVTIDNRGTIVGDFTWTQNDPTNMLTTTVSNSGDISGYWGLGNGNDIVESSGGWSGGIDLGDGNDTLILSGPNDFWTGLHGGDGLADKLTLTVPEGEAVNIQGGLSGFEYIWILGDGDLLITDTSNDGVFTFGGGQITLRGDNAGDFTTTGGGGQIVFKAYSWAPTTHSGTISTTLPVSLVDADGIVRLSGNYYGLDVINGTLDGDGAVSYFIDHSAGTVVSGTHTLDWTLKGNGSVTGDFTFGSRNNFVETSTGILSGTFDGGAGSDRLQFIPESGETASFSGSTTNFENFTKYNEGHLNFTGTGSFLSEAVLVGGSIQLDGALTGNLVTNNPFLEVGGGTALSGSGRVVGDLSIDGILAPGNKGANHAATFTVSGNYSQSQYAMLQLQVIGNSSDLLDIGGSASLNGALTVNIQLSDEEFMPGDTFTLISADGSVNGTFDTVDIQDLPFIGGTLGYTSNAVELTLTRKSFGQPHLNAQQDAIADMLDSLSGQGGSSVGILIDTLTHGSADLAASATQQLYPQFAADQLATLQQSQSMFVDGLEAAQTGFWVNGGALDARFIGSADQSDVSQVGRQVTFGYGYQYRDLNLAGAAGFTRSRTRETGDWQDNETTSWSLGAQALYPLGRVRLRGIVTGGFHDLQLARDINVAALNERLEATTTALTASLHTEASLPLSAYGVDVEPFVGAEAWILSRDGFVETSGGALGMNVSDQKMQRTDLFAGARLSRAFTHSSGIVVTPRLEAGVRKNTSYSDGKVQAAFKGDLATLIDVEGIAMNGNRAWIKTGVTISNGRALQGSISFRSEQSDWLTSNDVRASLSVRW